MHAVAISENICAFNAKYITMKYNSNLMFNEKHSTHDK